MTTLLQLKNWLEIVMSNINYIIGIQNSYYFAKQCISILLYKHFNFNHIEAILVLTSFIQYSFITLQIIARGKSH